MTRNSSVHMVQVRIVALLFIAFHAVTSSASPINDASYFETLPHVLIDFDTYADGTPLGFPVDTVTTMSPVQYLSKGILLSYDFRWDSSAHPDFAAARAIGGSPLFDLMIGSQPNQPVVTFTNDVSAFGFWVIARQLRSGLTRFDAYDAHQQLIESVSFGPTFVDGTIGIAQFGFMGIAAPGIHSVVVTSSSPSLGVYAVFDNLTYTTVPEPNTSAMCSSALFTIGLALCWLWRKRPNQNGTPLPS